MNTGKFLALLATAPIYLTSAHGSYILNKDTVPFTVPAKTVIIETVDIGESCYTSIDRVMWHLIQGNRRNKFLSYMKGIPYPSDSPEFQKLCLDVFKSVHIYEPGDLIFNRELGIGGGLDRDMYLKKERGVENINPFLRKTYANMGFFRFEFGDDPDVFPSGSDRTKILQRVRTKMIEEDRPKLLSNL